MKTKVPFFNTMTSIAVIGVVAAAIATYSSCDSAKTDAGKKSTTTEGTVDSEETKDADTTDTDKDPDAVKEEVVLEGVYIKSATLPDKTKKYKVGDELAFALTYSAAVDVTGTPRMKFLVGATTSTQTKEVLADYASGTGTATLTFKFTMAAGDFSPFGLKLAVVDAEKGSLIDLNGGTITSGGTAANLSLENFPSAAGINLAEGLKKTGEVFSFHGDTVAASCTAYRTDKRFTDESSGQYSIKDPADATKKITAFCDMTFEPNFGWMLVLNYVRPDGNTDTAVERTDLPVAVPGQKLGDDLSDNAAAWGHASTALVKSFKPQFLRWSCTAEGKTLHFKTEEALCVTAGGGGSAGQTGTCTAGTLLTQFSSLQGNEATYTFPTNGLVPDPLRSGDVVHTRNLTLNPFSTELGAAGFKAGWQVGGTGWDCERSVVNATTDTMHQVWIR